MAKRKARLKKSPECADFVVESTTYPGGDSTRTTFQYFTERKLARAFAKESSAQRVRIFHIKYALVSDVRQKK